MPPTRGKTNLALQFLSCPLDAAPALRDALIKKAQLSNYPTCYLVQWIAIADPAGQLRAGC
jgi:hypothetical protein